MQQRSIVGLRFIVRLLAADLEIPQRFRLEGCDDLGPCSELTEGGSCEDSLAVGGVGIVEAG